MKDIDGHIIYIGKAKNLKKRVSSYFRSFEGHTSKIKFLINKIDHFDFIITKTEAESFILENNLIKKYKPRYNTRLKDDAIYPYIVIDKGEIYPRLKYVRKIPNKKQLEVFGPFTTGSNLSEVFRILNKSIGLRDCSLREFKSRENPCLLYQLKQCTAPCVDLITASEYEKLLDLVESFLKGRTKSLLNFLEKKMKDFSAKELFEQAANIRDYIIKLKEFISHTRQQNVQFKSTLKNIDIMAYYKSEDHVTISIYTVRNGLLLGIRTFSFDLYLSHDLLEKEVVKHLCEIYLGQIYLIPEKIITPLDHSKRKLLETVINEAGKKVKVQSSRKNFSELYSLTLKHAKENHRVKAESRAFINLGLKKLQGLLNLPKLPEHLECYDIAVWQGSSPTASQIVFINGKPQKSKYRHYHLKDLPEGNNDFAMMNEVIRRRITHGDLPDVFIVDGGKGQVGIFNRALRESDINIPVVGIVKPKVKGEFTDVKVKKSIDKLVMTGGKKEYSLKNCVSLMKILTQMRDEAHRFSRKLHHQKEKKTFFSGWLDEIKGIGPKRKKKILSFMNCSIEELKEYTTEEISKKLQVSDILACRIVEKLNRL